MMRDVKMKNFSLYKILVVTVVVIASISVYLVLNPDSKTKEISTSDNIEITRVVSEYYKYLEEGNYELALFNLDLSESLMDGEIMLRGLYDINENIIEEFQVEQINEKAYYSKHYNSVIITVNYTLKYKGTMGCSTKDIVLMTYDNDVWKIKAIVGLDRYGFYRSPNYECQRLAESLDKRVVNKSVVQ